MARNARTPIRLLAFCLLALPLVVPAAGGGQAPPADPPVGQRVYVAGHSFSTGASRLLGQVAQVAGISGHRRVGVQGLGGSTVSQHWDLPDDKDRARKAIRSGGVDVLGLAANNPTLPDPAIEKFTALLLEHNPRGRVTVQGSWVGSDGLGVDRRTFRNAQRDAADPSSLRKAWAPYVDKVRGNVEAVDAKFAGTAGRRVVFYVPVAEAVIRLRERVVKGEVPGIARQSELFRDNLGHGKVPITMLTAYCQFAVIYGRNPVGLPVPEALKGAGLGEDTGRVNRILQEVAWEAVTSDPLSGVKLPQGDQ